ncbi:MAG TPA: hypothetical protein VFH77_06100 [Streptomyces sp.]|nr:hypothetical protein [Streptomyces sp.]
MPLRPKSMKAMREDREARGIDDSRHATDYRAGRGGWYPPDRDKPVPGTSKGRRGRG